MMSEKWPVILTLRCGIDKDTVKNINQQNQRNITKPKKEDKGQQNQGCQEGKKRHDKKMAEDCEGEVGLL